MFDDITSGLTHSTSGIMLTHNPLREAQVDMDGVFYHVAKPYDNTFDKDINGCIRFANYLVEASGSAVGRLHTTQALKGGREQMAFQHAYQAKRHGYQDDVYLQRVRELRKLFASYQDDLLYPDAQYYREADDSMAQRQHERTALHGVESSVIITADKDLNMCNGLLMNTNTREVSMVGTLVNGVWTDDWGWARFECGKGKTKKLTGRGKAFFFAQILAGDGADTIKGLPKISGSILDSFTPLKSGKRGDKEKTCGGALAATLITACGNEKTALKLVQMAYGMHFGQWGDFFLFENAFLLWMRLTDAPTDCLNYLGSLGFDYQLHPQQVSAIHTYFEQCKVTQEQLAYG